MTTTIALTAEDREFDFDPVNTSAEDWKVFGTSAAAKRGSCHHAYSPTVWAWRGGYITTPAGHPVPQSARLVARSVCGKWRPAN